MGLIEISTLLFMITGARLVQSVDPATAAVAKQLIQQAAEDFAPFKKTALERLHGEVFGSGRAARSTDITIFNRSGKTFQLVDDSCDTGGWTGKLLPEYVIPAHSSVVYGAESFGFMTGATECVVQYQATDGSASFEVNVSNPYIGPVLSCARTTGKLVSRVVTRRVNNNLVRVFIDENGIHRGQKKYQSRRGFLRCYE